MPPFSRLPDGGNWLQPSSSTASGAASTSAADFRIAQERSNLLTSRRLSSSSSSATAAEHRVSSSSPRPTKPHLSPQFARANDVDTDGRPLSQPRPNPHPTPSSGSRVGNGTAKSAEKTLARRPSAPNGSNYTIRSGESLWKIAQAKLGNGSRWRELHNSDGSAFTEAEARRLSPGTQVYLPGAQPSRLVAHQPPPKPRLSPQVALANGVDTSGRSLPSPRPNPSPKPSPSSSSSSPAAFRIKDREDLLQEQREQGAANRVRKATQQAIARLPNLPYTALNEEARQAKIREIQQTAMRQDPYYRSYMAKQKAQTDAILAVREYKQKAQEAKPLEEHKSWWQRNVINKLQGTPRGDITAGVIEGATDMGKGVASLGKGLYNLNFNPDPNVRRQTAQKVVATVKVIGQNLALQSISNPILAAKNFTTRPQETTQAFRDLWNGISQPYRDDLNSGHPLQAIGRGIFDIGSWFIPGGAVAKVGKGAKLATAASKTEEASRALGTASKVSNTSSKVDEVTTGADVIKIGTASTSEATTDTVASTSRVFKDRHTNVLQNTGLSPKSGSYTRTDRPGKTANSLEKPSSVGREHHSNGNATEDNRPLGARGGSSPLNKPSEWGTHRGTASERPFSPAKSGGDIQRLSVDRIRVQPNGINRIEQHLSRFGPDPQNAVQVQRLRDIAIGKTKPTSADLNFYAHELRESVRYRKLGYENRGTGAVWQPPDSHMVHQVWNDTHTATLEDYGVKEGPGVLYHPSVETGSKVSRPLGGREPNFDSHPSHSLVPSRHSFQSGQPARVVGIFKGTETSTGGRDVLLTSILKNEDKVTVANRAARGRETFLTYTLRDGNGEVRYVGKASGIGTSEQVMAGRLSKGHDTLKKHPDLVEARVEAVQSNKAANAGAEDVLYSYYQIPNPGVVSGKKLAGGANRGGQQLLNKTNPQSSLLAKIRNPYKYDTPRPGGKMSIFDIILAFAEDFRV
jgi:hypothetical protein